MKHGYLISLLLLVFPNGLVAAQQIGQVRGEEPERQVADEKLKASRIEARARALRAMRPMLGIPKLCLDDTAGYPTNVICGMAYGEKINCEKGIWISHNLDFSIPNWIACDIDLLASAEERDPLAKNFPAALINMDPSLWKAVLAECWKWAWDKPVGGTTMACGPLVRASDVTDGGNQPVPYEFFLVICKKTRGGLGYKSIGFLIPNRADVEGGIYKFSQCVNLIEHKSGYDFFPKLPEGIQENVEGMTTYELYCSYVEEAAYNDDPPEREDDWREALSDYLEDFHDR